MEKKRKRGKQEITSKAKIKNINDTLQSVMKQAKPTRRGKQGGGAAKRLREERFGKNADIKKMRKKIIKIRKIAQKQFTKEKNTNII